jgi:hypothetical protein
MRTTPWNGTGGWAGVSSLVAILGVMLVCTCCAGPKSQTVSARASGTEPAGTGNVKGPTTSTTTSRGPAGGSGQGSSPSTGQGATTVPKASQMPNSSKASTPTTAPSSSAVPSPANDNTSAVTASCDSAVQGIYQPKGSSAVSPFTVSSTSNVGQVGQACQNQVDLAQSMHEVAGDQYFIYNSWVREVAKAACASDAKSELCLSSS